MMLPNKLSKKGTTNTHPKTINLSTDQPTNQPTNQGEQWQRSGGGDDHGCGRI
jgi:hypothetical protein